MKQPKYIDGIGWRYDTEHRMTRWPHWKDSRLPGTYMFTLHVNSGQKLLGHLEGSTTVIRDWMHSHPAEVQTASSDPLYYRHALLGNRAMPFVLKETAPAAATPALTAASALTPALTPAAAAPTAALTAAAALTPAAAALTPALTPAVNDDGALAASVLVQRRFYDVAPPAHRRTHFPIEALRQPDAPHIVLTPLGTKVEEAWKRMTKVVPQIEHVSFAIMPNHLHAIIAVRETLPKAVGAVIRSFMGTTSHSLHQMIADGTVLWDASKSTITIKASAEKPSLWEEGFCVGVCQTETKLHSRIGYAMENPFFGVLEREHRDMMQRTMRLTIAGRSYGGYGNMLLLKEPDRLQVFCHRKHPVTGEPYHLTQDFHNEKADILQACSNGAVIVTPGISPGESDIMWSVLQAGGTVINIQKEEIPLTDKRHPKNELRLYCSQGQLLVLAVHDLPHQVFHDRWGQVIPTDSKYVRFHLLNIVAAEICAEGIEHSCTVATAKP